MLSPLEKCRITKKNMPQTQNVRCPWCHQNALYQDYHDQEWGQPLYNDQQLFEFLLLEGAQAGLSWLTILQKRDNYRLAFDHFDAGKIALYSEKRQQELLQNSGIIRNKLKIKAFINNAKAYLAVVKKHGGFEDYIWQFVGGTPLQNHWHSMSEVPATSPVSEKMSKTLKQAGFSFVGPTICYAFMQATGMVNDHLTTCPSHIKCKKLTFENT
jgi:DNA-3-methyladenine glycosylase I